MSAKRHLNISFIGEISVGKTAIANAINRSTFVDQYIPTVGASMVRIPYHNDGEEVWYNIWDTAGEEKFKSLAPVYYRDSCAACIIYDVTNIETITKVNEWLEFYRNTVGEKNPILVLGNKIDLLDERTTAQNQAEDLSKTLGSPVILVSAKTGENIPIIIPKLHEILQDTDPIENQSLTKTEKSGCCS